MMTCGLFDPDKPIKEYSEEKRRLLLFGPPKGEKVNAPFHPEEIDMLIGMLKNLKEQHNSVIVIEHDLSVIKVADEIIEIGPGAGVNGVKLFIKGSWQG